jgi:hypothetical protein
MLGKSAPSDDEHTEIVKTQALQLAYHMRL